MVCAGAVEAGVGGSVWCCEGSAEEPVCGLVVAVPLPGTVCGGAVGAACGVVEVIVVCRSGGGIVCEVLEWWLWKSTIDSQEWPGSVCWVLR